MQDYIISYCSIANLSTKHIIEKDNICFHFTKEGRQYWDNREHSIPFNDCYSTMTKSVVTMTRIIPKILD
ncbi:hypothetical protein BN3590_02311 [Clostridium sp. C105KSO15]|nr:hypothetical protein BN3590_02311 [Clostridium sp. C105KSO15]